MSEKVFYSPATISIIDFAKENEIGELVSEFSQEPIELIQMRYPGAIVCTLDEAIANKTKAFTKDPVEITKETFIDMLECLPPLGWERGMNSESFKMCEFTCGKITSIYARINKRYFQLSDVYTLKHVEIMKKIEDFLNSLNGESREVVPS
jgi:hypothetical protein